MKYGKIGKNQQFVNYLDVGMSKSLDLSYEIFRKIRSYRHDDHKMVHYFYSIFSVLVLTLHGVAYDKETERKQISNLLQLIESLYD